MTFNPAIPAPTDLISQSQAQIQTNFSQADTAFGIDHTAFSVSANQGQHKQVTLIAPISNPNQAGNISSVYTKTSGTGVELFYQHGTANLGVSQLTGGGITAAAYISFAGATGIALSGAFNATSVRNSAGVYTVSFPRNFGSTNYVAIITPTFLTSSNSFKVINISKSVSALGFVIQNQTAAFSDADSLEVVCFGVLA